MPESSELRKVLVVDDDRAMQLMLQRWVERAGYEVRVASDGYEAQAKVREDCPQLILTDWEMPGLDGVEFCKWLRKQDLPHYVYTILLTARSQSSDIVSGLQAGADDFLNKPVNKVELIARLKSGERVLALEDRLTLLAKTDSLTGLVTQRTIFERLDAEFERSERHHFPISCVMIDLDFFKQINDTHGHPAGDEVLRTVAGVLNSYTRSGDIIGRYGGEEFCAILSGADECQAVEWAERIRKKLAQTVIKVSGNTLHVSASFGAAQRLEDISTPDQLVDLADQALLIAKRAGRDRVIGFQSMSNALAMNSTGSLHGELLDDLTAADVMTTIVAGVQQGDTVEHVVDYFLRLRIGSAPVVDDEGYLVGVMSDKEIMTVLLRREWWKHKVADVMKENVVRFQESTPALTIYEFLCRTAISSVVIVQDDRPTGVISRGSLMRCFSNALVAALGRNNSESRSESLQTNDVRPQVLAVAEALQRNSAVLYEQLQASRREMAPSIVGGASRIQELVNDLLALSRDADVSVQPTAAPNDNLAIGAQAALRLAFGQPDANHAAAPNDA